MNKAELYKLLNQLDQELPKKEYEGNIVFDYKNSSTEIGLWCLIKSQDKILLVKRSSGVRLFPNRWYLVAGTYDRLISPEELAKEEIASELGITIDDSLIEVVDILEKVVKNKNWVIMVAAINLDVIPQKLTLNWENTNYEWVHLSQIKQYNLIPEMEEYLKTLE